LVLVLQRVLKINFLTLSRQWTQKTGQKRQNNQIGRRSALIEMLTLKDCLKVLRKQKLLNRIQMKKKINNKAILFIVALSSALMFGCASIAAALDGNFLFGWELPSYFKTQETKRDAKSLLASKWNDSFQVRKPGESLVYNVQSCSDYFRVREKNAEPISDLDLPVYSYMCLQCEATSLALGAKKGDDQYIRNLKLDETLADVLPSEIEFGQDVPKGKTWKEVSGVKFVEATKTYLSFKSLSFGYRLYPIAYGDFNSDGLTDLMIILQSYALDGNYTLSSCFVLTRTSKDKLLQVVKRIDAFR
jgi:hypothetical protein